MRTILDSGALIAIERGDRQLVAAIKRDRLSERAPLTHGGVIGQVWRGGADRQVSLARVLRMVEIVALDEDLGRRAGVLLGRAGGSDVIDAAVVLLAQNDDRILTSDPEDLAALAAAAGADVEIVPV